VSAIGLREGPYHYGKDDYRKTRTAGGKQFTLIISSAFNAYGLIGSEFNGIVCLNDTDLQVVFDQDCRETSGYYGPSDAQLRRFDALLAMPDDEFLRVCTSHPNYRPGSAITEPPAAIPAKFDWGKSCSYDMDAKIAFHNAARQRLKQVAQHLGLAPEDYDLRTNKAGIAVSGETTLHCDGLYVQVGQSCMGNNNGILFRGCDHRKDYTGHRNNFAALSELDDPRMLADKVKRVMRVDAR
jgi:hypothetical protein